MLDEYVSFSSFIRTLLFLWVCSCHLLSFVIGLEFAQFGDTDRALVSAHTLGARSIISTGSPILRQTALHCCHCHCPPTGLCHLYGQPSTLKDAGVDFSPIRPLMMTLMMSKCSRSCALIRHPSFD